MRIDYLLKNYLFHGVLIFFWIVVVISYFIYGFKKLTASIHVFRGKSSLLDLSIGICLAIWFAISSLHANHKNIDISYSVIIANGILYVMIVLAIFFIKKMQSHSCLEYFHLQPHLYLSSIKKGCLILLVTYPLFLITQYTVQTIFNVNDQQLIIRYFLYHPDIKNRILMFLMTVIIAPIAEELIFRGYFYRILNDFFGRWVAMIFSSILFALIHAHAPSFIGLVVLAFILAWSYEYSHSLITPITIHSLFNLITILILLYSPNDFF